MDQITSAREAILAALIGDVDKLLNRLEEIGPEMDRSRLALTGAARKLGDAVPSFAAQIHTLTHAARRSAAEHVVVVANQAARRTVQEQTVALQQAATAIFTHEVTPNLQQLSMLIRHDIQSRRQPWLRWTLYAATAMFAAVASSAISVMVVLHVLGIA